MVATVVEEDEAAGRVREGVTINPLFSSLVGQQSANA